MHAQKQKRSKRMAKSPNQKLKLLYLQQLLLQKTDDEHRLTADELIEALAQ